MLCLGGGLGQILQPVQLAPVIHYPLLANRRQLNIGVGFLVHKPLFDLQQTSLLQLRQMAGQVAFGQPCGALEENEYREKLGRAGFESIDVEATRVYRVEEAREFLEAAGLDAKTVGPQIDGKFISAFVRAVKPAAQSACCGPSCCA